MTPEKFTIERKPALTPSPLAGEGGLAKRGRMRGGRAKLDGLRPCRRKSRQPVRHIPISRRMRCIRPAGSRDAFSRMATACTQLGRGHIGLSLSSGCAAAPLRFVPPGDNASPMRPLAIMAFADQSRLISRLCAAKTTESRKPEPRGAVKAREAPAKRLGLDGEHCSGAPSYVYVYIFPGKGGRS